MLNQHVDSWILCMVRVPGHFRVHATVNGGCGRRPITCKCEFTIVLKLFLESRGNLIVVKLRSVLTVVVFCVGNAQFHDQISKWEIRVGHIVAIVGL